MTALMVAQYYLLLLTYYLLKPARDALFLTEVEPAQLPQVFILTALLTTPVAALYSRASARMSLDRMIYATSVLLILSLLVLRWFFTFEQRWVYFAFYSFVSIVGGLTTSQYWLLANAVFDAAQARRIFALLGIGGIAGAFTGGEVTSFLVTHLGVATVDLVLVSGGVLGLCSILAMLIWRHAGDLTERATVRVRREQLQDGGRVHFLRMVRSIIASRHLTLTVGIIAMSVMVGSFIDYQFKTVSVQSFAGQGELTAFLGQFYGRISIASLAVQLLIAPHLIRWLGVGGVLLLLPSVLLLGSAAMFMLPGLMVGMLLRGGELSLKYSLNKTGQELLFLPIPLALKKRTKIFIDLFVDRWSRGLAGLLLLLCVGVLGLGVREISLVVAALVCIWLILAWRMRSVYVESFRRALRRRDIALEAVRSQIPDAGAVELLLSTLQSDNPREVIYALRLLANERDQRILQAVRQLLDHANGEIRHLALSVLIDGEAADLQPAATPLLADDELEVRSRAVGALLPAAEPDRLATLRDFLSTERPAVRNAALHYIAHHGVEAAGKLIDDSVVRPLLDAVSPGDEEGRQALALALGAMPADRSDAWWEKLLSDESPLVVRSAMSGVGRQRNRRWLSVLLDGLGDRRLRLAARSALVDFGGVIVPDLIAYFTAANRKPALRINAMRVLGKIGDREVIDKLLALLDRPGDVPRRAILSLLGQLKQRHPELRFKRRRVLAEIEDEVQLLEVVTRVEGLLAREGRPATTAGRDAADAVQRSDLLKRAVGEFREHRLESIFRWLGLIYSATDINNAYRGLMSGERVPRANAYEYLDNILTDKLRRQVLPLVDPQVLAGEFIPETEMSQVVLRDYHDALCVLMDGEDAWLKCCAIYAADPDADPRLHRRITAAASDKLPMVRETAVKVLAETGHQGPSPAYSE